MFIFVCNLFIVWIEHKYVVIINYESCDLGICAVFLRDKQRISYRPIQRGVVIRGLLCADEMPWVRMYLGK